MNRTVRRLLAAAATGTLLAVTAGCGDASSPRAGQPDDTAPTVTVPLGTPTGADAGSLDEPDLTPSSAPDQPEAPTGDATAGPDGPPVTTPDVADSYNLTLPIDLADLEAVAGDAAGFAALYASYDYRIPAENRMEALEGYLAKQHLVPLADAVPTGPLAERYVRDKVVTTAEVHDVALVLLSTNSAVFAVDVAVSTSLGGQVVATDMEYAVTMRQDRRFWNVEAISVGGDGHGHQH